MVLHAPKKFYCSSETSFSEVYIYQCSPTRATWLCIRRVNVTRWVCSLGLKQHITRYMVYTGYTKCTRAKQATRHRKNVQNGELHTVVMFRTKNTLIKGLP